MSRPDENKNEHPVVHPIPPVYRADSRILILGSFPSVKSRETGFFYGHPQNRFWKVTAAVCGEEVPPIFGRFTATGRPRGSITGSTRRSSWDGKRFAFRRRVPRTPHGLWSGCLASGASAEKSYETESDRMKKEYETVWEIFNECANNQMRDVFFDEIETDDPEAYIRQKFPDKNLKYEKTVEADGSLVFDIETSGIRQRFTFTEI